MLDAQKKMTQTREIMFRASGTRRKRAQEQDMIIITIGHAAEVRPTPLELGARAFLRWPTRKTSEIIKIHDLRASERLDLRHFSMKNQQKITDFRDFSDFRGCVSRAHGRYRGSCAMPLAWIGHDI